jgi:pimeloyl-ACP methyl ester carboxylesterase
VTVFAHGYGQRIAETRPLASGVTGTKIFFQFRGHGRSSAPPGPWSYRDLADDLVAVADSHEATRAVGVSLGAGALCRVVQERPDRFERLVFFLPAVFDTPRSRELSAVPSPEVPDSPAGAAYLAQREEYLRRYPLAPQLGTLAGAVPVDRVEGLAAVAVPAMILACRGDDLHPVSVAEQLAAALPDATLHVYDRPGVLWHERADLRARISGFLDG